MAIVIRHGQRWRVRWGVFSSKSFTVSRYEREHDSQDWMFVIRDNVNHHVMECDGEDARALERDLEQGVKGLLSKADFEAKLRRAFEEVLAMEATLRRS